MAHIKSRQVGAAILAGALSFAGSLPSSSGVELVQNGGFEMNDGFNGDNIGFGWVNPAGPPIFDVYSHTTQIYYEGPAPAGAGDWYFHTVGVPVTGDGVYQDVDLTTAATPAQIDSGTVRFDLSAWLSGYTAQTDHADVELRFFDAGGAQVGGPLIFDGADFGPDSFFDTTVTGADPSTFANPLAAWKRYEAIQGVAVGARTARVAVTGTGNDNYADLVSFDVADTGVQQFLKLRVNQSNGVVSMENATADSVGINYYEVVSPSGSLSLSGWNSFSDQDLDTLGPNPGQSWDEGGGSSDFQLIEAFLLGSTTFATSGSNTLGQAYDVGVGAQDLEFYYAGTNGNLVRGVVEYFTGISGDFDGNGDYACADIDSLVAEIAAGTNNLSFDLTGDDLVNGDDLVAWLAEAGAAELTSGNPYLPGDATLDEPVSTVNGQDFVVWNNNKFTATAAWCSGDFNADGFVNGQDFVIWNNNKFTSADGHVGAVPEPSAALFCVFIAGAGLLRTLREE